MSNFYFQKSPWAPFVYQGNSFDLSHLNECILEVVEDGNLPRRIAVTFSDHCFTRDSKPGDEPELLYPGCSRSPGYFSRTRYHHSLTIAGHLAGVVQGNVWNANGNNYAIVPTVNHHGSPVLYGIFFSLDRVKGLPVHLHMRIQSAFPCDKKPVVTFGRVKFKRLVKLRMQGQHPPRITGPNRKRPELKQPR